MQACDRCHARKTRCDRRIPQCSACEKAGTQCLHADKLRQRNLPRNYIDSMESMLHQLREENSKLRRDLAHSRREGPGTLPVSGSDDERASLHQHGSRSNTLALSPDTSVSNPATLSGSGESPDDACAREVGYLSLIATGETRYLGSSSGIGLATIINKVLTAQSGVSLLAVNPSSRGGSMVTDHTHEPPASSGDANFPSRSAAMSLIETYFQHTHITFPLLHRPSFMTIVERIYSEPQYYESNPADAFSFDMVLAIGASNFNRFGEAAAGASMHYTAAQNKIANMMDMDGLTTLRSILLICQHAIFSNLRDTSANVWHLVGIGARICIELGLHLERQSFDSQVRSVPQHAKSTSWEEEMTRRCFWCLYNLDRVVSFTLGRPVVLRDEEIDIPLPSHLDDDHFGPNKPIISTTIAARNDQPEDTSPFLHLIRIRRLSGKILGLFYITRNTNNTSIQERRQMRHKLYLEVRAWWEDTQHLPLPRSEAEQNYVSSFLDLDWYRVVYNNAVLLLYRPSPYLQHLTMIPGPEAEEPDLLRLLNAARDSIKSYSELHKKRRLNYSWITLHGVFIAGLAYIYCIGRMLRDPTIRPQVPDLLNIIEITRSCSNVLVAICERWNASRRSCELFEKLTDAVIRDALNLSSRQETGNDESTQRVNGTSSFANGDAPEPNQRQMRPGHQEQQHPQPYNEPYDGDIMDSAPHFDDILVADQFRQFAGSFGMSSLDQQSTFPSEVLSGFSQDWPFDAQFTSASSGFDTSMQGMGSNW